MPELPEVETTKRKLEPLVGETISGFWNDWPREIRSSFSWREIERDIKDRKILRLWRHGKVIFFDLGPPASPVSTNLSRRARRGKPEKKETQVERLLAFHLRMSGRLIIHNSSSIPHDSEKKYIHTKVFLRDKTELWFKDPRKFGVVWYGIPGQVKRDNYVAKLGPDARGISFKEFALRLSQHKGAIKAVLLRQDVIAGAGNIVADETLWASKIHPKTRILKLETRRLQKIHSSLQEVLERGIQHHGTTLRDWKDPSGRAGQFQNYMKVYGRKGKPCLRCKTKIVRLVVAGRGTWICPFCQEETHGVIGH